MAQKGNGKGGFGGDGLEDVSTAFFTRPLCPPVGPVADPGRARPPTRRAPAAAAAMATGR